MFKPVFAVRVSNSFMPNSPVELFDIKGRSLGYAKLWQFIHILVSYDDMRHSTQGA